MRVFQAPQPDKIIYHGSHIDDDDQMIIIVHEKRTRTEINILWNGKSEIKTVEVITIEQILNPKREDRTIISTFEHYPLKTSEKTQFLSEKWNKKSWRNKYDPNRGTIKLVEKKLKEVNLYILRPIVNILLHQYENLFPNVSYYANHLIYSKEPYLTEINPKKLLTHQNPFLREFIKELI